MIVIIGQDDGLTILSLFESTQVKVVIQTLHDYDKQRTYIPHYEDQERIKKYSSHRSKKS